jgi:hypothetical protein
MGISARALLVASVLTTLLVAIPSAATEAEMRSEAREAPPKACTPREKCCEVCTIGKACGKACIQASKKCHKGRGCSCNASEVCEESGEAH